MSLAKPLKHDRSTRPSPPLLAVLRNPAETLISKHPTLQKTVPSSPVTVSTSLSNVEAIYIYASNNPTPLTSAYELSGTAQPYIATRIKMGKTADVIAVVKADGKLLSAKKEVKVTIGGCGG